jgi:N-acetylglucosaminyl-diphospho-decaprenol L-rhamnosyltransferase
MIDVSIIIVSYNTAKLTCDAIASVFAETTKCKFEIIVVDNFSEDNSVLEIERKFKEIRLLKLQANIGFAAANNIGTKEAKGKYILLLNPDTVVLDGAIDTLVCFAEENPRWGIYGGSTFFGDMSRNPTAGWNMATVWSLFCTAAGLSSVFRYSSVLNPESLASWDWKGFRKVDIVTGCFLLIRREHWKKLNGFDLSFRMYGEDADLCLRSSAEGKDCVLVSSAKIIHYGGASEKIKADKMVKVFKAKIKLFQKHWGRNKSSFGIFVFLVWALSRMSIFRVFILFSSKYTDSYLSWKDVWNRRDEWVNN